MNQKLPDFLLHPETFHSVSNHNKTNSSYVEKTLANVTGLIRRAHLQYDIAGRKGLLQGINPRVKLLFLTGFVLLVNMESTISAQVGIMLLWAFLYGFSRLRGSFFWVQCCCQEFFLELSWHCLLP